MAISNKEKPLLQNTKILLDKGILETWSNKNAITTWDKFENAINKLEIKGTNKQKTQWSFRGEGNWDDEITSSIEKAANQHCIKLDQLYDECIEQGIIRKFKREFFRMQNYQPCDSDHMAWLSIMQHHGAPTRLVDITYSIYIALYFALWKYQPGKNAAIWCFNNSWINDGWEELSPKGFLDEYDNDKEGRYIELFNIVFCSIEPKIYLINPFNPPERLVMQQGGFLVPLDIKKEFMKNLSYMPLNPICRKGKKEFKYRIVKMQIKFSQHELENVRYRLLRMNINNATLFPGLDGYSRSLYDRLPFKEQRSGLKKGFGINK